MDGAAVDMVAAAAMAATVFLAGLLSRRSVPPNGWVAAMVAMVFLVGLWAVTAFLVGLWAATTLLQVIAGVVALEVALP